MRVVKESLATTGPLCNANIQKATDTVSNLVKDMDGRLQLKTIFRLVQSKHSHRFKYRGHKRGWGESRKSSTSIDVSFSTY